MAGAGADSVGGAWAVSGERGEHEKKEEFKSHMTAPLAGGRVRAGRVCIGSTEALDHCRGREGGDPWKTNQAGEDSCGRWGAGGKHRPEPPR